MDISTLLEPIFSTFWWLIPIALVIGVMKTPWFKGILGESAVNLSVIYSLDSKTYHLFKNVTLPTDSGTTQIDHIVVSAYGIFVVETKNMKGWIFGGEKKPTWTQKIYKHTTKFQNPLRQNYGHVKTLQALLDLNEDQIFSVIVFVGDNQFKTDMPASVTRGRGYLRYIQSKTAKVLTSEQVTAIVERIESGRLEASIATHRAHVQHVRETVRKKKSTASCPQCGNPMVLRKAKKGPKAGKAFWGCSQFPSCREVLSVKEISS